MLREIRLEIGPMPGICSFNSTIVNHIVSRLKSKLVVRGLKVNTTINSSLTRGSKFLEKGIQFSGKMKLIYTFGELTCTERPGFNFTNVY